MYLYGPPYHLGKKNLPKKEWDILCEFLDTLQKHREEIHTKYPSHIWMDYPTNSFARDFYETINISSACTKITLKALDATLEESGRDNGYDLRVITGINIEQLKEIMRVLEMQEKNK